jgi:hypothetical protein
MALGKRKPKQDELFIPTVKLATGPGHQFYAKLNDTVGGVSAGDDHVCPPSLSFSKARFFYVSVKQFISSYRIKRTG